MNKALFSFLLLLLIAASAQAQSTMPLYTGVFYKLSENAPGYYSVYDTVASPTSSAPYALQKNDKLLITAYPFANWAKGVKKSSALLVRTKYLVLVEKPPVGTEEATVGSPMAKPTLQTTNSTSVPSATSPQYVAPASTDIQIGPRGGHYYINSNGHKTYIKHR